MIIKEILCSVFFAVSFSKVVYLSWYQSDHWEVEFLRDNETDLRRCWLLGKSYGHFVFFRVLKLQGCTGIVRCFCIGNERRSEGWDFILRIHRFIWSIVCTFRRQRSSIFRHVMPETLRDCQLSLSWHLPKSNWTPMRMSLRVQGNTEWRVSYHWIHSANRSRSTPLLSIRNWTRESNFCVSSTTQRSQPKLYW